MLKPTTRTVILLLMLSSLAVPAWAESGMEERMKAMELRLHALENENRNLKEQATRTEQKVEVAGNHMEKMASQGAPSRAAWAEKTNFGGYGELHLNKLKNRKTGGVNRDELDFHRFVLFMGHEFNDRTRFFSELEVEHAVSKDTAAGSTGLVTVEQAYIDFALNDMLSAKAGIMLMPIGIVSETHEPPTFYGVERNPVETGIIPTTWREGGVALTAKMGNGFTVDGAITSGLSTTAARSYAVRDGRLSVASAKAKAPAYTARLKWSGMPGVEVAGALHRQSDITQGADATAGAATLYEAHVVVNKGAFGLRALYAGWSLNGSGPKAVGADKQNGWYVEPSWRFSEQWGVFARRSNWDNKAGDAANSRFGQTDMGINFWPHPDVVVKLDYQNQQSPAGLDEFDGFNLGLGYQF